jgi:uncharacterized protein with von Willebrand factor type A (vWA) domain
VYGDKEELGKAVVLALREVASMQKHAKANVRLSARTALRMFSIYILLSMMLHICLEGC